MNSEIVWAEGLEARLKLAAHLAQFALTLRKRPGATAARPRLDRGRDHLQSEAKCEANFGLAFGLLCVYTEAGLGAAAAEPRPSLAL